MTQACATCGTRVYEFGFCSHCGAPLCPACIGKHEMTMGIVAGRTSHTIRIPFGGLIGQAIETGLGYHRTDTIDFPFPHCPACVEAHARNQKLVSVASLAAGGFFFGLILFGMLHGSGYMWSAMGIFSVLAAILGGIAAFVAFMMIRGLPYREEVIRCPRCGRDAQDEFISQGAAGKAIVPYGSEGINMRSRTYLAGFTRDSGSWELADHFSCPHCGYSGPLKDRMGLHKFVKKNGVAALQGTMWESVVRGY